MEKYYNKGDTQIYSCDNLDLLCGLPDESINLIYCDILYNTGKTFRDYNDNLGSPEEAVEWYRPRFIEMKRVLAANGSIFIHLNWRLEPYIQILMNNVFGGECYKNCIHRKHSKMRGFVYGFDSQMDTIFYYVKNPTNYVFNEKHGDVWYAQPLCENGLLEGRSAPRNFNGEVIDPGKRNMHWLINSHDWDRLIENKEIVIRAGLPYRYTNVIPVGNLWDEDEMLDSYDRSGIADAYDTPKPEAVLDRIISMCSNPGDTVADFFMGGGTTAVVAKKLGRKFIGCDISQKACEITVGKLENLF